MLKIILLILIAVVLIVIVGTLIFRHEIKDFLHKSKLSEKQKEQEFELKRLERELESTPEDYFFGLHRDELKRDIKNLKEEMKEESY